jgi:predicted dienelactone hydrolase
MQSRAVVGVLAVSIVGATLLAGVTPPPASAGTADTKGLTTITETFVDDTRTSPASATQPEVPSRTLVTTIMFPKASKKPLPLLVLAHGANGNTNKFDELIARWAKAGYVVAAPLFPRSSDVGGNYIQDVAQQPADVSLVIDEVLRLNRAKKSPLRGRVDAKRIGLGGMSLGGWTSYGAVFHPCCRDTRIDALVLMAAVRAGFAGGDYEFRSVPTLLLHGDADGLYPQSTGAYPEMVAPKWFVTLAGGTHASPFEDTPDPYTEVVGATTVAFWDRYLKGDRRAAAALEAAVAASGGLASLQRDAP